MLRSRCSTHTATVLFISLTLPRSDQLTPGKKCCAINSKRLSRTFRKRNIGRAVSLGDSFSVSAEVDGDSIQVHTAEEGALRLHGCWKALVVPLMSTGWSLSKALFLRLSLPVVSVCASN